MDDVEVVLRDILAMLKSIDAKLTPRQLKAAYNLKLGRVFGPGDTIPFEVDLVMGDGGLRWCREFQPGPAGGFPTDNWYPRDVEGPVLATNELLSRAGHVTEIPAPTNTEASQ